MQQQPFYSNKKIVVAYKKRGTDTRRGNARAVKAVFMLLLEILMKFERVVHISGAIHVNAINIVN